MDITGFQNSTHSLGQKRASPFSLISLLIIILLWPSMKMAAQGDLVITPRRIVFEDSKKSQEINMANSGKDTARYNISFVQVRMKDDGSFEWITAPDPGQNFADKYLRYYPRTVVLGPNEAQTVKVELANANRLSPGEYRSHLYFRAVPVEKLLGDEQTSRDSTSMSVQLVPIFGITIPVIIRVGRSTATVTMADVSLDVVNDTLSRISFVLNRSGNMSVYGDIKITQISPQGKSIQIGSIGGLGVYTPGTLRRCQFDIATARGLNLHEGRLHVEYLTTSDIRAKRLTDAEITLH